MIAWGINALNHGHSVAVFNNGTLVSNVNGTSNELSSETIRRSLDWGSPDRIYWYERPWIKKVRQLYAGQWDDAFDTSVIPSRYLKGVNLSYAAIKYTPHHASHAAAGYYTSPFDDCAVVVLDAIGEFECASIWKGRQGKLHKVWSKNYPNSLGLFYSSFTKLIGLEPIKDEYVLQQMSDKGDPTRFYSDVKKYVTSTVELTVNLHRGVYDWTAEIDNDQDKYDIAAAVQKVFEEQILSVMSLAKSLTGTDSLVYMGGCAMNSKANLKVTKEWRRVWSLPNPGDFSSSIGAVLYHTKQKLKWQGTLAKHIQISV